MEYPLNHLDPINVATIVFSVYFGPAIAAIVGPYTVIILCSTVGVAWSLGRRNPTSKMAALRYFLLLNATAMLVTVAMAQQLASLMGTDNFHWLLSPIALAIGAIGNDWPSVVKWAIQRFLPSKETT